ncbi:MAG TPA: Panacea domain-containing protein [Solirubrobacteraceae bacterium]|nr:Panacea domain-containing protein [Solirubrobacteraceae bacterium]
MDAQFNAHKFNELIVYIATRLGPEAALGRTKLAKLLMKSDFGAYARRGQPITGATYEKWEQGHLPRELLLAQRDLEADGSICTEEVDYYGKRLKRITALRDPDLREFSDEDLADAERAIALFGHESASYLSELSHMEVGWRLAHMKEVIPYNTVFLGVGGVSEGDVRRGEELASSHGWN